MFVRNKKILNIFYKITKRLPSNYPKVTVVVYRNIKKLQSNYWKINGTELDMGDPGHPPFAFCNSEDNSIHVPLIMNRETVADIGLYILHEIGHLVALQKYGENDPRWYDYKISERYANRFANRWCNKLKREQFFRDI